jgi:light-regulated signal transduction histidine kinase (bacteriophytochrome)
VKRLQDAHPERDVDVVIEKGMTARGDQTLLESVYTNLIDNAWKYTGKVARPRIEVGSKTDGKTRIFFVKDNGAGFDMRYASKLFGAFQRLHRQDEFEGIGIGLATVLRIINRHGGKVWAEAAPNAGATFYFTLGSQSGADSAPTMGGRVV